ncbi:MAG TPA: TonB-dependent receptor [Thermoanaerobaculia bacterium]|nr:TonB-dependent receptor [Thermoanaerobaculia bacterium]
MKQPIVAGVPIILCLSLAAPPAYPVQTDQIAQSSRLKGLSIEELMEIDVTSVSRRSEPVSGAAAAITVITSEDIRRSGANNLPDALRIAVGLEVAQSDGSTWAISSRGFNATTANKLLVLIDGRTIYTPLFSGVFWDVQDVMLEDIDRIEIIRGPGATLWGANAVNGVINILTKSAADTQGSLVSLGGGTEERALASFRQGGKLGEGTSYRAYGKYSYRDSLAFTNGDSARDPLRRGQAGFRVDRADRADRGSGALTLQGDAYHGLAGQQVITRADTDLDGANLLGRWTHTYAENSGSDIQVYYDYTHRRIPLWFEEHRHTLDVDYQHRQPVGARQDLVWGAGYRVTHDEVDNSQGLSFLPERRTQNLFSAFAQDELALDSHLRLTVGTKVEHNAWTGFEVQPSARLAWVPNERRTLWAAVSRAVRTPTRLDEDLTFYDVEGRPFLTGSRDFKPESLLAYEIGYRLQPRTGVQLDLATFYNVYRDLRTVERLPDGTQLLANGLDAETWGAELRASVQATPWWRLHAGYAYFDKQLSLDPGSNDPSGGRNEGNDPRNRFVLRSLIDLPGGFEFDSTARYVARLPAPVVPAYTELDLRLGWNASDRLEFSLVGQNLLHARHPEFGFPSPLRREIERGAYGKVTWRF